MPSKPDLRQILEHRFGHTEFRPYQEEVCRVLTAGNDLLLVMPTGAGKSLCYQLPGVASGGTTLVVSPLIALMEDQVASLREWGLLAERIHSGRPRADSRRACADYLAGKLEFLFIAPERLGVRGFPELLARRKPALIAVDEAHCISHWGHDFRPDYRMLKERLPLLRPAPVIAMTATATPLVQRDIVSQLGMNDARLFIHGFRRENIAIELVEVRPQNRSGMVRKLLAESGRRPALVYAPTRKQAEALAEELATSHPAAAYHAGLEAEQRDLVQAAFLAGELEVVVATIAFGMGIDKPDIRTVIHTAMPGSVEGYYQEIGRAGRDGKLSRAVLLHSYADIHLHRFFLDRDYPEVPVLRRMFLALDERGKGKDRLREELGLDEESFEKALEKLRIHGGAVVGGDESVARGEPSWDRPYSAQRRHRQEQLALIARFVSGRRCRMLDLVAHFGDRADSGKPCGSCDFCSPSTTAALNLRRPDRAERADMEQILTALSRMSGQSTGRLYRQLFGESLKRDRFERLLSALARAGLVAVVEDSFERDGRVIEFKRARLTQPGRDGADIGAALIEDEAVVATRRAGVSRKTGKASNGKPKPARAPSTDVPSTELVDELKRWRLAEARRQAIPPYCILHDSVLMRIAEANPLAKRGLLAIKGIGPTLTSKYGDAILEIIARRTERRQGD
jgi:DNA topoisomerase-3